MKRVFITVHNDQAVGAWEMPETMLGLLNRFMEALATGNEDKIVWHGDPDSLAWAIKPRLLPPGNPLIGPKIGAIKVIRSYYGVNLKDGKTIVDRAPCELQPITYATALAMKAELETFGYTLELPNVLERMSKALGEVGL